MNRTLNSLLGVALLAIGATGVTAQTGSLQGQRTILNDGGLTPATFNRITLTTPSDPTLTGDYQLLLPPNDGNANDIIYTPDGVGTLEFTDGNGLFWRLLGNTSTNPALHLVGTTDGQDLRVGTTDPGAVGAGNGDLILLTNDTERARILGSDGSMGIGTAPNNFFRLYVAGESGEISGYFETDASGIPSLAVVNTNASGIGIGVIAEDIGIQVGPSFATSPLVGATINAQAVGLLINDGGAAPAAVGVSVEGSPTAIFVDDGNIGLDVDNMSTAIRIRESSRGLDIQSGDNLINGDVRIDDDGSYSGSDNVTLVRITGGSGQGTNNMFVVENDAGSNIISVDESPAGIGRLIIGQNSGTPIDARIHLRNGASGGTARIQVQNSLATGRTYNIPTIEAAGEFVVADGQGNTGDLLISQGTGNRAVWSGTAVAEQGVSYGLETEYAFRLGSTTNTGVPLEVNRFVNLANFDLTFTTNGGASNLLVLDGDAANGSVDITAYGTGINTITGNTQINELAIASPSGDLSDAGGAVTVADDLNVTGSSTLGDADADVNAIRGVTTINTAGTANTTIGNATGTVQVISPGLNVATNGTLSDAGGEVEVDDNLHLLASGGTARRLRFQDLDATHSTTFRAGNQAADIDYILPLTTTVTTAAEEGILQLDVATGQLSWLDISNLVDADQGLIYNETGTDFEVRLGALADGSNPITGNRFIRLTGGSLTINDGTRTLFNVASGDVNINSAGAGTTDIGSAAAGAITAQSATTIGLTAGTTASIASATTNVNTSSGNVNIGNAAGTNTVVGSTNVDGATTINDGANAFTTGIGTTGNTGAVTIGNTANTVSIAGGTNTVTGTTNINTTGNAATTIGSLTNTGGVAIRGNAATSVEIDVANVANNLVLNNINTTTTPENILSINASNQVRRTSFSNLADEGLQWDAVSGDFKLGATPDGTNPILSSRFVRVGAAGTLTFNNGSITMLSLPNSGAVAMNGVTLSLNTTGTGTTAIGNGTGTFQLTSNALNIATNGDISDAASAVTIADDLLVTGNTTLGDAGGETVTINTAGTSDLVLTETTISRAAADIAVNPGSANRVTTDGGLLVSQSTQLGDGSLGDAVAVELGAGSFVTIDSDNGGAGADLQLDQSTIQRIGDIAINPGAANNITSNGGIDIAGGATIDGLVTLGDAAGDVVTFNAGIVNLANLPAYTVGATNTFLMRSVGNQMQTYTVTGTVSTGSGTAGRMTRWTGANALGDASLDDNGTGTLSRAGDIALNPGTGNDVTTDGSLVIGENLTVTGTTVTMANLPNTGAIADELVTTDGTVLRTATVATMLGGTPWLLGGNTAGAAATLGTDDDFSLSFETNGTARMTIADNTGTGDVNILTDLDVDLTLNVDGAATLNGDVTLGNAATDAIQVDGDLQGAGANKFSERVQIVADGVDGIYDIANTLITANSVVIVTCESSATSGTEPFAAISGRNAGVGFQITLGNGFNPVVGDDFYINYIIINP